MYRQPASAGLGSAFRLVGLGSGSVVESMRRPSGCERAALVQWSHSANGLQNLPRPSHIVMDRIHGNRLPQHSDRRHKPS